MSTHHSRVPTSRPRSLLGTAITAGILACATGGISGCADTQREPRSPPPVFLTAADVPLSMLPPAPERRAHARQAASSQQGQPPPVQGPRNRQIEESLGMLVLSDPAERHSDVDIFATRGGTVTLRGTVPDERAHERVRQLAERHPGVVAVVDQLRVAPRASR